jgi:tRNA U54 and U55 pseudouridine synthase Pus10
VERSKGKNYTFIIKCDGGLSINGLITGTDPTEKNKIEPNIQESLNMMVDCDFFDILNVEIITKSKN